MSCSLALKDQILIPAFLHWLSLCVCPLQTLRTPLIFSEPTVICNPVFRGSLMSCRKYAVFAYHYPSTRGQGKPKFGPYHWEKWEFLFPSSTLGFERPRCLIHNHWSVITIIGLSKLRAESPGIGQSILLFMTTNTRNLWQIIRTAQHQTNTNTNSLSYLWLRCTLVLEVLKVL